MPNIWSGILSAAFISIAVVLGEYTIASLSGYETLQVQIVLIGKSDGPTSVAASLATLVFGFVLLLILALVTRGRRRGTAARIRPSPRQPPQHNLEFRHDEWRFRRAERPHEGLRDRAREEQSRSSQGPRRADAAHRAG